jgi:hypothetical protein
VASADSNEPYPKNDLSELQHLNAAVPMPSWQQIAASAPVSMLPIEPTDSFESRWGGSQKADADIPFNARWALDSK